MATVLKHDLYVSQRDLARLRRLVDAAHSRLDCDTTYLDRLESVLDLARPVAARAIPSDVVTVNSRVRLRFEDGSEREYSVVFPEEADPASGRVSVLAPLGVALLGAREGEEIDWETPAGWRSATVAALLYQPEAQGDYHL